MSAAFVPGGFNQSGAMLPFANERGDYFRRHRRMVYGIDDDSLNSFRQRANTTGDRRAHLALRIGIDRKNNLGVHEVSFESGTSRAPAKNHDNGLNAAGS